MYRYKRIRQCYSSHDVIRLFEFGIHTEELMALNIVHDAKAKASLITENDYRLEWIPEKNYISGTEIEIRLGSLRAFVDWRFVQWSTTEGDITYRWKVRYDVSEMRLNPNRVLLRICFPYGARKSRPVAIACRAIPSNWSGINSVLSVWVLDHIGRAGAVDESVEARKEKGAECELVTYPAPVERFLIYSKPYASAGDTVRTILLPTDRFGNPSAFSSTVPVRVSWNDLSEVYDVAGTTEIELPYPTRPISRACASLPVPALAPDETIATGHREGAEYLIRGNPVWRDSECESVPAFGEFHWHTDISGDGSRTIEQALSAARDAYNFDYIAPGDHNPRGSDWADTVAALEEFNEDGQFATFFGWEASSDRGHENIYFTDPNHPLVCEGSAGYSGSRPDEFPDELESITDYIRIPHHTNAIAETRNSDTGVPYWHEYPWNRPAEAVRLAEIIQTRGNNEKNVYTDVWRGWHQNHGASLQDALAQGYEIGFVGGTDNHCGWPGRAFAECEGDAYTQPPYTVILTGLWTKTVTRDDVFSALYARNTWAVVDTRAIVKFAVNGVPSGGILEIDKHKQISATIRLSAEDSLASVEIVSHCETLWQESFVEEDIDISVDLGTAVDDTQLYLRALERKGGLIYASPVFLRVK